MPNDTPRNPNPNLNPNPNPNPNPIRRLPLPFTEKVEDAHLQE